MPFRPLKSATGASASAMIVLKKVLDRRGAIGALDITKDIQPMTTFRNHSAEVMRHLRETGRPVVLTVNGKAAAVVQDAEAYQRLLDLAAGANAAEGIRQGLEDLKHGRTRAARAVFDEIRSEHGIPR
jgi:prevent-host-death family protein